MSGGVDSAVAAARAVEAGHDVTGVHLALSTNPTSFRTGARGCCTLEDARDARRAADVIGIPFYVWDLAERFREDVVDDFVAEYAAGRTPNPCLRCNEKIKFAAVLDKALALGFDAVCTGHHARLGPDAAAPRRRPGQGPVVRARGADRGPARPRDVPARRLTKADVRAGGERRGLAVADKPDSHDICFIADGDTRRLPADRLGAGAGRIVDVRERCSASTPAPTGSRSASARAARVDRPAADGKPRYVLDISPVSRTVTVGTAEALDVARRRGQARRGLVRRRPADACSVQVRAHGRALLHRRSRRR